MITDAEADAIVQAISEQGARMLHEAECHGLVCVMKGERVAIGTPTASRGPEELARVLYACRAVIDDILRDLGHDPAERRGRLESMSSQWLDATTNKKGLS